MPLPGHRPHQVHPAAAPVSTQSDRVPENQHRRTGKVAQDPSVPEKDDCRVASRQDGPDSNGVLESESSDMVGSHKEVARIKVERGAKKIWATAWERANQVQTHPIAVTFLAILPVFDMVSDLWTIAVWYTTGYLWSAAVSLGALVLSSRFAITLIFMNDSGDGLGSDWGLRSPMSIPLLIVPFLGPLVIEYYDEQDDYDGTLGQLPLYPLYCAWDIFWLIFGLPFLTGILVHTMLPRLEAFGRWVASGKFESRWFDDDDDDDVESRDVSKLLQLLAQALWEDIPQLLLQVRLYTMTDNDAAPPYLFWTSSTASLLSALYNLSRVWTGRKAIIEQTRPSQYQ